MMELNKKNLDQDSVYPLKKSIFFIFIFFLFGPAFVPFPAQSEVSLDFERFHQVMELRFGKSQAELSKAWEKMLKETADLTEEDEKVLQISRFFHAHLGHESDPRLWGVEDYWATPLELMGQGKGDCKDWATAKYFSLRIAGLRDQKLRLIYAAARVDEPEGSAAKPHMVLGYYPCAESEPFILDNLMPYVMPWSQREDLTPIFSFNSQGLWTGIADDAALSGTTDSLLRWRDLLNRFREEGAEWQ